MLSIILVLLGFVFIVYALVIFCAQTGSLFFVTWIILGLIAEGLAWMSFKGLFSLLPKAVLIPAAGVFTAAAVFFLFLLFCIGTHFHDQTDRDLDYLIVLGAQVREDGPSRVLLYRLQAAADYLSLHPETKCIVTGGKGNNEPASEAEIMAEWMIEKGISPERIIPEEKAVNTVENVAFSRRLIPAEASVGIVTNNFHLFRALRLAKGQGIDSATGISAPSTPLFLPHNLFRECLGITKDRICGNLRFFD